MKYFYWKLDCGEPIEPENPLGDIKLSGESGSIEEKDVMLDSFLEALSHGMRKIQILDRVIVDTIDEPTSLNFERKSLGVKLSYGFQEMRIENEELFQLELSQVIDELKSKINGC